MTNWLEQVPVMVELCPAARIPTTRIESGRPEVTPAQHPGEAREKDHLRQHSKILLCVTSPSSWPHTHLYQALSQKLDLGPDLILEAFNLNSAG